MKSKRILLTALALAVLAQPVFPQIHATFTTIHRFRPEFQDGNPHVGLTVGLNGVLYGMSMNDVYALSPPTAPGSGWTLTYLYSFNYINGGEYNPVTLGADGQVYGTTYYGGLSNPGCSGGCGTVFMLTPPASPSQSWTETTLYNFAGSPDGWYPREVVVGQNGILYGTTQAGGDDGPGCNGGCGTIFSLTPPAATGGAWLETIIYRFAGRPDDGANPLSLQIGSDGSIYGATYAGGNAPHKRCSGGGCGTIFRLTPPSSSGGVWTEQVLYSFAGGQDGGRPTGLTLAPGGQIYGAASSGGAKKNGEVFELLPPSSPGGPWTKQVLYDFTGPPDGSGPEGVVMGSNGMLYGVTGSGGMSASNGNCSEIGTQTCGTVFELLPPASSGGAWNERIIHLFSGEGDGGQPHGLVMDANGVMYGTTTYGGTHSGGTVFQVKP